MKGHWKPYGGGLTPSMQGGGADASCLAAQAAETSSLGGCGQARGVDVYVTVHGLLARRLQPHLGHGLLGGRVRVRG